MVPLLNTARMSPMRSFRCTTTLVLILLLWPPNTGLRAEDTGPSPGPSSSPQRDVPDNMIFSADFEHTKPGIYTEEQLDQEWNSPEWSDGIEERRVSVVTTDSETRAIAVTYPAHTYGPEKKRCCLETQI